MKQLKSICLLLGAMILVLLATQKAYAGSSDVTNRITRAVTQLVQGNVNGAVNQAIPPVRRSVAGNTQLYVQGTRAGVTHPVGVNALNNRFVNLGGQVGATANVNPTARSGGIRPNASLNAGNRYVSNRTSFALPQFQVNQE